MSSQKKSYTNIKECCFTRISITFLLVVQQQLQSLMETLNSTEPHYVRCVKPNSLNRPQKFEKRSILHQLRCGVSGLCLYALIFCCFVFRNGHSC